MSSTAKSVPACDPKLEFAKKTFSTSIKGPIEGFLLGHYDYASFMIQFDTLVCGYLAASGRSTEVNTPSDDDSTESD